MTQEQMLTRINNKVCNCQKCPALAQTRTQTVFGTGNPNATIVFCGEAPGRNEDEEGVPFVGRAGVLLDKILQACGMIKEEVYILNTLKCRPPNNRNPSEEEAANCRPFLDLQLKVINPKYIVCLGAIASNNILKNEEPLPMYKMRKQFFEYKNKPVDAKVLCTYHPAYLLRNPDAKQEVWDDLQILLNDYQKPR